MARPFKLFLILVGLVLMVIIAALVTLVMTFDANNYKQQVSQLVKDKTGRDLTIGDVHLSVFPWVKVSLSEVTLSNAPGFGDQPFAKVGEAKVGVQLVPLLKERKVVVDGVELDGLTLNLAKAADGKTNWDDLASSSEEEKPEEPKVEGKASFRLEDIDIGGVEISNAAIRYQDDQTKQAYQIRDFNLKTGPLKAGQAFDIESSVKAALEAQKLDTTLEFKTRVNPNLETQEIELSNLKLSATVRGAQEADADLEGTLKGSLQTKVFDLSGLKLSLKAKSGDFDVAATLAAIVRADLNAQQFSANGVQLNATLGGKALPGGSQKVELVAGAIKANLANGTGEANDVVVKADALEVETKLSLKNLNGDAPQFSGPIAIKPFNARELIAKFSKEPLTMSDPKALTSVSLSTQLDGSTKRIRLDDLRLKLDDSTLTGNVNVRDISAMAIAFALKLDQIDADRYMAPREEKKADDKPFDSTELNKTEIPTDALTDLDVDGTVDIGKLKLRGANITDVRLAVSGPKGSPKQASLSGKLYGGQFTANTRIAPGATPQYALKTSLQSITIGPALLDFTGNDKLSGIGTVNLDITTAGKTVGDIRKALNGSIALDLQNGAIKGFNLGEMLRHGQALLSGQQYVKSAEPVQTDFASLMFSGQIVNGVLKSDSLDGRNPLLRVAGAGEIDLANETFNYTAKPTIVETSKGQGGRGLEELGGLTVPVKLTGSFANPKVKVDIAGAAKEKATAAVKQQLDEHKDELKQKLNDKYGDKLNEKLGPELAPALENLFGKKKKKKEEPAAQPAAEPEAQQPQEQEPQPEPSNP